VETDLLTFQVVADSTLGMFDALLPAGSINIETQDSRFCRFKTGLAGRSV
jgi:hypothetical protein